ncbi:MAG: hypothetical protein EpisKO_41430 [Epibacterium sp.]
MAQNTSMAVMQQRIEPHDSLEDFPTPPWATRALMEFLLSRYGREVGARLFASMVCREPCANRGFMARPLGEYFGTVEAADICDYGAGFEVRDYLFGPLPDLVDWTITNPPFRLAEQFIQRALASSRIGCAMLVRTSFLETVGRYENLFSEQPPAVVLQFAGRVVMQKGKMLNPDVAVPVYSEKLEREIMRKPSTATSYCWLIWIHGSDGTAFAWVPPLRKKLEQPGDYGGAA